MDPARHGSAQVGDPRLPLLAPLGTTPTSGLKLNPGASEVFYTVNSAPGLGFLLEPNQ